MRTYHEYTKAKNTNSLIQEYRPLRIRQLRLKERPGRVKQETVAAVLPSSLAIVPSDRQKTEFLHQLVIRLDREITDDTESSKADKTLSLQNVILSVLVMRSLAVDIWPELEAV